MPGALVQVALDYSARLKVDFGLLCTFKHTAFRSSAELPTFDSQLSTTGQGVACRTTQSQVTRTVMGNCSTRRSQRILCRVICTAS